MRNWLTAMTVILAAGIVATTAAAHPAAGRSNVVRITAVAGAYRYDPKTLKVPAGQVTIMFVNRSTRQHNVSLEQGETEYGATVTIGVGTISTILTLKKGVYHFYSSFGKDEDRGMAGTLTVG